MYNLSYELPGTSLQSLALVSSLQIYFLPLPANEREKSVPKKATRFRVSVHLNGLLAQPLYFSFWGLFPPQTGRICNATEVEFLSSFFERKRPFFALFSFDPLLVFFEYYVPEKQKGNNRPMWRSQRPPSFSLHGRKMDLTVPE